GVNLTTAGDVAAAVQYLQNNDWGAAGATVAFTAVVAGITHTYVFTQTMAAGGTGELVDLQSVLATGIVDNGTTLSVVGTASAELVTDPLIDASEATAVSYTVSGLSPGSTAVAHFTDGITTVDVNIAANGTFTNLNLSSLADGLIYSTIDTTD